MKKLFYLKLAWQGMRKNGKLYRPFLLTCIGMIAMFYILIALSYSPAVASMPSGSNTTAVTLRLGAIVLGIFSVIFLFYTNSFLIRRRDREFGLYNVLGMGKRNLAKILLWETLIEAVISLCGGLFGGILLSKLFEAALLKLSGMTVGFDFYISSESLIITLLMFAAIFTLQFLSSVLKIGVSKPVELLKSESHGEKPPKANYLLGILGILLLAAAYWLALNIENPITALTVFFFAVIMVIVATYLILISGSVMLCRILQKRKGYYYKKRHFVSVSSMAYRMKRNGAGLASICILATMVLVMISSTSCLYIGAEDSISTLYPRDMNLSYSFEDNLDGVSDESIDSLRSHTMELIGNFDPELEDKFSDIIDIRTGSVAGVMSGGKLSTDPEHLGELTEQDAINDVFDTVIVEIVPLDDYLSNTGESLSLADDEIYVYSNRIGCDFDTFSVNGGKSMSVKAVLTDFPDYGSIRSSYIVPTIYIVVADFEGYLGDIISDMKALGETELPYFNWYYNFNADCEPAVLVELQDYLENNMHDIFMENSSLRLYDSDLLDQNRNDFLVAFGGLFFLGIALSIIFIIAAVLIIYYKQVSEGYEDKRRYEIMQNVGMTKREIRQGINSQLLTVFFLPLLLSGLHLVFAFPFISKMLMLMNVFNTALLIATTAVSFLVFALLYALVYRITGNAYFKIVSER